MTDKEILQAIDRLDMELPFDEICVGGDNNWHEIDVHEMLYEVKERITWHYPSMGEYPTDHDTVILYGKLKYEHEKEYEYFIDVGEWLGNMWSSDLERWSTVNDWYEGQQEYEIVAWMPFPNPPEVDNE